jgi:hypothetical protein
MEAVVIQVYHGNGLASMAELALIGPHRFGECWLNETHRIHLLEANPLWPRLILLEPQNIRFVYPHEASVDVHLDSLAALDLGDRVLLDDESLELLEAAGLKHHRHGLAGRVLGIDHLASRVLAGERENALLEHLTMVLYYSWGAYNIAAMNSSTNVTRHPSIGDEKQSPARVFTEDFVVDVLPGLRRLLYPRQRGCPDSGGGRGRALPARPCLRLNRAAGTASPTPGDGCRTAPALAARAKWLQAVEMRPVTPCPALGSPSPPPPPPPPWQRSGVVRRPAR